MPNWKECWLFLDGQIMTGYPPKHCPNYHNCKRNALHSSNRVCNLPYIVYEEEFLWSKALIVNNPEIEAIEAGWYEAID